MYSTRVEGTVRPGKTRAFEAKAEDVYDLLKRQPGFRGASLLLSAGFPGAYTSLVSWENRAAARRFALSEDCERFYAGEPFSSLLTPGAPTQAAEVIAGVGEPVSAGAALMLVDWTIDPAKEAAFIESRQQVLQLRSKYALGFRRGALARVLTGPGRFGLTSAFDTEEQLFASIAIPELNAFGQAHPPSEYGGTAKVHRFEVIMAAVPAMAVA